MYNTAQLETYGQKGFIYRFFAILRGLNRKGYLVLNMSRELAKNLAKQGITK
jgi:hypothetical protein